MREIFHDIASNLSSFDWPTTLQGIGAIWVALVASIALGAWKKQLKATKSTEHIDLLSDTIYEFILLMNPPLSLLYFTKIDFVSYADSHLNIPKAEKQSGVLKYIERNGEESSKKLFERLSPAREVLGKMKALAIKSEVLNLPGYEKCQYSIMMLERSFNQVEKFASFLGSPHLNGENPIIQESLYFFKEIEPEIIVKDIETQHSAFISFAKGVYAKSIK